MQQNYAAQALLGGTSRADQQSAYLQSVAASILLGSRVDVIDDDLIDDDYLL